MAPWTALIVQALVGGIVFWVGRLRWLGIYAIVWPFVWFVPLLLVSLHCTGCEYAAWYLRVLYLTLALVRKAAIAGRANEDAAIARGRARVLLGGMSPKLCMSNDCGLTSNRTHRYAAYFWVTSVAVRPVSLNVRAAHRANPLAQPPEILEESQPCRALISLRRC